MQMKQQLILYLIFDYFFRPPDYAIKPILETRDKRVSNG